MATTITVSSAAQLTAALSKAGSGDTILLAGGDYGNLFLGTTTAFGKGFTSPVTIAAADPANPPEFSGLDLRGVSNLTFKDVTFDYTFQTGDALYTAPFKVGYGSSNVTFEGCTFDGDAAKGVSATADGYGYGIGLSIRDSSGVRVEDCEMQGFWKGAVFTSINNLTVADNDIHSMRMDGLNFVAVQGAVIEGNHIHDFKTSPNSGDHSDMIQFWTNGSTRPSTDIVIRNNMLDIGEGDFTQSIFMRNDLVDRGLAGPEMFYQRITIENNVIVNAHTHGITVGEAAGLTIRSNSVLHADGGNADGLDTDVEIPKISVAETSTGVTITQNATAAINGFSGQSGWTVTKNAIVQDQNPYAAGWYGNVFVASSLQTVDGVHRFVALPGSLLDQLDAGAVATLTPSANTVLDAAFHVMTPVAGDQIRNFDASLTTGSQPAGTTYLWSFGDGSTATGKTVTHSYSSGGTYDVRLTVRTPDGKINSETLAVAVDGDGLVRLDDSGAFAVYAGCEETLLAPAKTASANGVQLGAAGVSAAIDREHVASMLQTRDVTIALTLDADKAGTVGEVARLHGSFVIAVDSKGAVVATAISSLGQEVKLVSTGVKVNDTAAHDIELRLEGGRLQLWVDDKKTADAAFEGTFADAGTHDLTFGNAWGKTNFYGDLLAFEALVNDGAGSQAFTDAPFTAAKPVALPSPAELPAPEPDSAAEAVTVAGDGLVRLDDSGAFAVYAEGAETLLAPAKTASGSGVQLGAAGISAAIDREYVAKMLHSDDVTIALTLDADQAGAAGEVARLHGSFIISVDATGTVLARAFSSLGQEVRLYSTGIKVNDTAAHDIELRLEGGRMQLWVDDRKTADAAFEGTFANAGSHDLAFGNAWGKTNFYGDLTAFEIIVDDGPGSQAFTDDPFTAAHTMDLAGPVM